MGSLLFSDSNGRQRWLASSVASDFHCVSRDDRISNFCKFIFSFVCRNNMLQLSSGIEQAGSMNWKLAFCLLFAWVMVYFCIWKGIRTTGKVCHISKCCFDKRQAHLNRAESSFVKFLRKICKSYHRQLLFKPVKMTSMILDRNIGLGQTTS